MSNHRTGPEPEAEVPTVILNLAEVVRVSMNVAELFILAGTAFVVGFALGWWVK